MYEKQSRNTNRSTDTIASFLLKTYEILEHSEYERIISWDKTNVGFVIHDVVLFTRQILPKYFRHSNFSSFVRQLNMYDFHKVKQQNQSLVFKNPLFCKGEQQNLKFIRRKAAKKVGGQRRQHLSQKNEVQNQKYETLLKGFKKSIESEINQSALFYERSIHIMKDLNESNLKKQSYIKKLYLTEEKTQTTEEIKTGEIPSIQESNREQGATPKKDTIIQIPKQFLAPKQSLGKDVKEKQNFEKHHQKHHQKQLNLDNMMLLKEEVYKSLGTYQSWLQDYIETQRKKIKYINGYRQQLAKCKETKVTQHAKSQDQQIGGWNLLGNSYKNVEFSEEELNEKPSIGLQNILKYPQRRNEYGESESIRKMQSMNVIEENESQSLIFKLQNKISLPVNRGFFQSFKDQSNKKQSCVEVMSPVKVLSMGHQKFESMLFSAFSQSKPKQSIMKEPQFPLKYEEEQPDKNLPNRSQLHEEINKVSSSD